MRPCVLCFLLAITPLAVIADEMSLVIYFQPDSSGDNTERNELEIDETELKAEHSADRLYELADREATADEINELRKLISSRIQSFQPDDMPRIKYPRLEVELEIKGANHSIEVEERYAVGELPEIYVKFQQLFFEKIYK